MSEPVITVRHDEDAVEVRTMCSPDVMRAGMDVHAEVRYTHGQHLAAFAAVERMAENLRRQIADAAESGPRD